MTGLTDTDVLVHALRGQDDAAENLHAQRRPRISAVTRMELLLGVQDKRSLKELNRFLRVLTVHEVPLDAATGTQATEFLERHALGDGLRLGDALIAATAVVHGLPLLTGNHKHFKKLKGLEVVRFRP